MKALQAITRGLDCSAANHSNEIWVAGVTGSVEAMLILRMVNKEGSVKWVATEEPAAVEAGMPISL